VQVLLVDDLDGKPVDQGNGDTIRFGLDGAEYEIDLRDKNVDEMRKLFARYIGAARKVGGPGSASRRFRSGRSASSGRNYNPKAVREWAEKQGIEVSARGRVPPRSSLSSRTPTAELRIGPQRPVWNLVVGGTCSNPSPTPRSPLKSNNASSCRPPDCQIRHDRLADGRMKDLHGSLL